SNSIPSGRDRDNEVTRAWLRCVRFQGAVTLMGGLGQTTLTGLTGAIKMALTLSSSAFTPGGSIPVEYTCEGKDVAPALEWSGAPAGTKSLVLIMDDPDAPDPQAPKMTYVHWVLYDIPPGVTGIPRGGPTPAGARDGKNDWKKTGYGGPCPPRGGIAT